MNVVKVKICGITNIEDAKVAIASKADALGFVFAPSPRRITDVAAGKIIGKLPPSLLSVGVFVNEQLARVREIIKRCNLSAVQFHGEESPDYCAHFEKVKVIKAFRVKNSDSLKSLSDYKVDAFLLDTYLQGEAGGTGTKFNWNLVSSLKDPPQRIILSGGLSPDNVTEAIKIVKPYAVDVSTGVESRPGKKDPKLVEEFIRKAKGAL